MKICVFLIALKLAKTTKNIYVLPDFFRNEIVHEIEYDIEYEIDNDIVTNLTISK